MAKAADIARKFDITTLTLPAVVSKITAKKRVVSHIRKLAKSDAVGSFEVFFKAIVATTQDKSFKVAIGDLINAYLHFSELEYQSSQAFLSANKPVAELIWNQQTLRVLGTKSLAKTVSRKSRWLVENPLNVNICNVFLETY